LLLTVGTSLLARIFNAITDFRGVNQRMHDKTAIFDGIAGITGGRNMADEYFDFDHEYNFRDRDILLLGLAVADMSRNFDEFWTSSLAVPVEDVLDDAAAIVSDEDALMRAQELHAYAADPANFDAPGKNEDTSGLGGGGESTDRLLEAVQGADHTVLIQSPYLIMPKGGVELFASLTKRGVRIRISTNSLASTDNIAAFSGYHRQRARLERWRRAI
jgi:putative cardiolipin synthase